MDEYIEKHLYDVLLSIEETKSYFEGRPKIHQDFEKDILRQRAVERNVEIMGEAINRILKIDLDFQLPHTRAIVNTRNRVIHGYDSVTPDFSLDAYHETYPGAEGGCDGIVEKIISLVEGISFYKRIFIRCYF